MIRFEFLVTEGMMKKFSIRFATVLLLCLATNHSAEGQTPPQLPILPTAVYVYGTAADGFRFYQEQKADRWCWAASAAMIMAFHQQPQWLQCIQADDAYPGKAYPRTCCDVDESENPQSENPLCNRTGWPHFEHYQFHYRQSSTPPSWDELVNEINLKRPLAVAVKFATGGGHMGVVVGYQLGPNDEQQVLVVDPDGFHSAVLVRFDDIFGEADDYVYKHWRTYSEIYPLVP
jgi:hypothetical protein